MPPEASDNLATFDFLHCHNHLPSEGAALIKKNPHIQRDKGKNIHSFAQEKQSALLSEGTRSELWKVIKQFWSLEISL